MQSDDHGQADAFDPGEKQTINPTCNLRLSSFRGRVWQPSSHGLGHILHASYRVVNKHASTLNFKHSNVFSEDEGQCSQSSSQPPAEQTGYSRPSSPWRA